VKIHNGAFVRFSTTNAPLINNNILSLTIDQNDNIWIGHLNAGVTKLDNSGNWTVFNNDKGFSGKDICFVTSENNKLSFYGYDGNVYNFGNGATQTIENKSFNSNQLLVHYTSNTERYWVFYNNTTGVVSVGNQNKPDFKLNLKIKNSFYTTNEGISFKPGNELALK
jgi:ligand-binding sensor domain-containing protein